ncbi:extracellular solute-binding protein [Alloscardovia omnicolens]|uniref:extracellular solute-binding protein n=1 Tax=Alloscardovia omnicolens TaxID=419015 RepID=UPI0021510413|nr:extracellular solute-binding protein [Alloscardovia omnicolens]
MLASLAACGNSSSASASKTADGKTIIKIQTFNNFGYGKPTNERPGADLWAQYEKLNPNVKVEEIVAATSDDARSAFNTAISSGSNAYDVYAVDINWMPSITSMPDKFMDQTKYLKDNDWLDWKVEAGKTSDGKMIGASNDIGPSAVCYRRDLFEKAGLPSDRAEVQSFLAVIPRHGISTSKLVRNIRIKQVFLGMTPWGAHGLQCVRKIKKRT